MKQEESQKISKQDFISIINNANYKYVEFVTYTFRIEPTCSLEVMDKKMRKYYSILSKATGLHIYPFIFLKMKERIIETRARCGERSTQKRRKGVVLE